MVAGVGLAFRSPVGRERELGEVVGLVRQAVAGQAGTQLVFGEAGVGKTALLRQACRDADPDADVLWATCLPLSSLAVPFLPLVSALRDWPEKRRSGVPVLTGDDPRVAAGNGPLEFDGWLDRACRERPVVLVVDDLHWADQSSLDVLMYVLAGPAGRRLAVLASLRAGEVVEGHRLHRWLADVRRLPRVGALQVGRLDRAATAQQLAGLLDGQPHQALVDEVYARTHGNPYLTALLVRGVPADARSLPAGLPTELQEAVSRAWHGLSAPARRVAQVVAAAGRPQTADQLRAVRARVGARGALVPLLREAVDGGV
jgi:hypothetical protein